MRNIEVKAAKKKLTPEQERFFNEFASTHHKEILTLARKIVRIFSPCYTLDRLKRNASDGCTYYIGGKAIKPYFGGDFYFAVFATESNKVAVELRCDPGYFQDVDTDFSIYKECNPNTFAKDLLRLINNQAAESLLKFELEEIRVKQIRTLLDRAEDAG